MAFNFTVPEVKIPEIKIPEVKIDTTKFHQIHNQAAAATEMGNKLALTSRLSSYKIQTIHTPLNAEDREVVTGIVREMASHGWLNESVTAWCQEHQIIIP